MTFATLLGTMRRMWEEEKRVTNQNSLARARSTTKVINAVAQTLNGCAVSTGGIPMAARIEFCHCAARHSAVTATPSPAAATTAFAIDRSRAEGSGSSR